MYRVIIVDDEATIRQGIRKILQRFAPQWELVGEAEDGVSGLGQILRLQPDLVILDFRMPGLNGIEVCGQIAAQAPRVHRILLTAYQDFQLAKQAIHYGVLEFITKPLDRQELLQTLAKAENLVDKERSEQARLVSLEQSVSQAAPLAQKLYYQHFIFGQDDQEVEQFIIDAGYPPPYGRDDDSLFVLSASPDWLGKDAFTPFDVELFRYALTKYIQEWHGDSDNAYVLRDHIGQVVVLLGFAAGNASAEQEVRDLAHRLKRDIERSFNRTVTIGISGPRSFAEAPAAYQEASLAVTYRIVKGGNQVLVLPELNAEKKMSDSVLEQLEESLEQLLQGRDAAACAIVEEIASSGSLAPVDLNRMIVHFMLQLGARLKLMDLDMESISGKSLEAWLNALEAAVTRASLMETIGAIMGELGRRIRQERDASNAPLADKVKQHVVQYLADGVSLQSVADRFGMNASYFSRWFKYETGQNFVAFLKECRIGKAKALLEQNRFGLQEISEQIGYADVKHFCRVFKEHTDHSPTEYKKLHLRK